MQDLQSKLQAELEGFSIACSVDLTTTKTMLETRPNTTPKTSQWQWLRFVQSPLFPFCCCLLLPPAFIQSICWQWSQAENEIPNSIGISNGKDSDGKKNRINENEQDNNEENVKHDAWPTHLGSSWKSGRALAWEHWLGFLSGLLGGACRNWWVDMREVETREGGSGWEFGRWYTGIQELESSGSWRELSEMGGSGSWEVDRIRCLAGRLCLCRSSVIKSFVLAQQKGLFYDTIVRPPAI